MEYEGCLLIAHVAKGDLALTKAFIMEYERLPWGILWPVVVLALTKAFIMEYEWDLAGCGGLRGGSCIDQSFHHGVRENTRA